MGQLVTLFPVRSPPLDAVVSQGDIQGPGSALVHDAVLTVHAGFAVRALGAGGATHPGGAVRSRIADEATAPAGSARPIGQNWNL
jgi:hypothetical protein